MNKKETEVVLRKATLEDSRFVWKLANDSKVRDVSFSLEPIPWESHKNWFLTKLEDANCQFLIAENQAGTKIGQVRFDLKEEGDWVISLSIVEEFRGQGFGRQVIDLGSELLLKKHLDVNKIYAYIKNDNLASIRVFEKANYKTVGQATVNSKHDAVLMVLEK